MTTSAAKANRNADIVDRLEAENARLRARERKIIDATWGEALEDGSVPSTKLQDKIIAAVNASEQKADDAGRS